jgi:arylsulfatase A-like enzyme
MRLLASFLVVLLAVACNREPAAPGKPNVVVIVLDTVRPDYLSAYGDPRPTSPFLKRFAATATRYDRAWSSSPWTLPAHASLFSGTLPAFHRATQATEHVADDVPLLAERLHAAGYQTLGLTNNNWISKATGLDRGFELLRDQWDIRQRRRSMGATHPTVQALKEWFQRGRKPDQPFFLFVNLTDAHMPYLPHWEEARDFFESTKAWEAAINALFPDTGSALLARNYGGGKPLQENELEQLRNLYRGALLRTDRITEALLGLVDAHSAPADTLVFVLSDHGENLGEHGHLSHIFNLYDTNLRIALLARGRGFAAGAQEQRPVQITDLYPTILRAAGLEPEASCAGLDLRGDLPAQRLFCASLERPVVSLGTFPESVQRSGVLARFDRTLESALLGDAKQIAAGDGSCERYDLRQDPGELNVLSELAAEAERATGDAIARTREAWKARASREVKGNATTDERTRAGLKHLGYTAGDK